MTDYIHKQLSYIIPEENRDTYDGEVRTYRSLLVTYAIDSPVGDQVAYAVTGG